MNFGEFIERFDCPGSVVLLEGKRTVAVSDRPRLQALGQLLARRTRHILFRSGNASWAAPVIPWPSANETVFRSLTRDAGFSGWKTESRIPFLIMRSKV